MGLGGKSRTGKSRAASPLLGGLTPQEFLKTYWQKRPLLVRQALPGFTDLLSPDELAGLATDPGIQARLVFEQGQGRGTRRRPWSVEHGPFAAERLRRLPAEHWSLLVSEVDHWVEDAAHLLDQFNFIPNWRLDDLMVSFAPPGGSVGPHVDSYDVFLVQGHGRRRWEIAAKYAEDLVEGADLRVLKRFRPEAGWVLEPGDMLYLPPGVAHHGVALSNCMTYSVGFRAPSQRALIDDLYNLPPALSALLPQDRLYADPDLELGTNAGCMSPEALARVAELVAAPLRDTALLGRWFCSHATRPSRAPDRDGPPSRRRRPAPAAVERQLRAGARLWRDDAHRLVFFEPRRGQLFLYADGEELELDAGLKGLVAALCQKRCNSGAALLRRVPKAKRAAALALLGELLGRRAVYWK